MVVFAVNLTPAPVAATSVSLSSVFNRTAITVNGTGVSGLANDGYAFSSSLLPTSVTFGGQAFTIGSANASDAVVAATIPLPAGSFSSLTILATKCYSSSSGETFVVTYTDGTTTSFVQGMSDWGAQQGYAGETVASSMAYRVTPSGTTQNGPWYLFGYTFTLNSAKTVKSLTLPSDSNVVVFAVNLTPAAAPAPATSVTSVNLAPSANVTGIAANGTSVSGIAGTGYALSSTLLGNSVSFGGQTFSIGAANAADAVNAATIALPAGNYRTLSFLATSSGNQTNQTFVVTYADGTTTSYNQSLSDWGTPQNYAGESIALSMAYRVTPSGGTQTGPWYLYGYTFPLNSAKVAKSVTLPSGSGTVVYAVNVSSQIATNATGVASVDLMPYFNVPAIASDTSTASTTVYNQSGFTHLYPSNAIGANSIGWNGSSFALGPIDGNDAVSNAVVNLPAGNYGRLDVLGSRVNGNNASETFVVTYTNGTTASFTQGMSDWYNNNKTLANFAGESTAIWLSYLHGGASATSYGQTASVFGYSFALDPTRTVKSVTLPADADVGILAMNLGPAAVAPAIPAAGTAQAVITEHNDTWRTGDNTAESQLTPATVGNTTGSNVFGRLGSIALDGQVDGQPLVVPGISVVGDPNAGNHDVVYVATENNTVYAINPVTLTVLTSVNLGTPVPNPLNAFNQGVAGVRSTPVIDVAAGALYVVTYVQASAGPTYQLHKLSLSTLADIVPAVTIGTSAPLTNGATYAFNATYQIQRPALLETNGMIVVTFASWGDLSANLSRGWVLRFDATSLALVTGDTDLLDSQSATNSSNTYLAGIWMSGVGPAVDESGNLYVSTGNGAPGTYDGVTSLQESVLKLSPSSGQLLDIYTPNSVNTLDQNDEDLSAGGVLLLPNANKQVGAILSKDAIIRVFNRTKLGGNNDANLLTTVNADQCWCGLSYFNDGQDRLVSLGNSTMRLFNWQTSPTSALTQYATAQAPGGQAPGALTSVSQSGTANGIIWTTPRPLTFPSTGDNMNLMAFQAQPVNGVLPLLYLAPAGSWMHGGGGSDNNPPTIANGRVYVSSYKELVIFGFGGKR